MSPAATDHRGALSGDRRVAGSNVRSEAVVSIATQLPMSDLDRCHRALSPPDFPLAARIRMPQKHVRTRTNTEGVKGAPALHMYGYLQ